MKTDPSALLPAEPRLHASTASQARAGRWLADLERAMLDARPQDDAARPVKAPQPRMAPAAPAVPPSAVPSAFASPASAALPHALQSTTSTTAAAPVVALAASQPMNTAASRDAAPGVPARSAVTAVPLPDRPAATALREAALTDPSTAHAATVPLPEPRRYARRLMQASGHAQVQITLRDAALQAGQAPIVARAVFEQLRDTGVSVQRIYVNGQVFDASLRDEPAPTPSNPFKD